MRSRIAILLLLPLFLTSCANAVVLHPIDKLDILSVPEGTVINGVKVTKAGYFLSDFYLKEVAKARIEQEK